MFHSAEAICYRKLDRMLENFNRGINQKKKGIKLTIDNLEGKIYKIKN
jgi:hypothetical protein